MAARRLCRPSDPLVGDLWSFFTDRSPRIRGSARETQKDGSRIEPSWRLSCECLPGSTRLFGYRLLSLLRAFLPLIAARLGGGDEETRTPDPLLAKEVLFQLSYVPLAQKAGKWWAFLDSNQRPLPYQGSALTS